MQNEILSLQMTLEKEVELKRREMQLEKKRASELVDKIVEAEIKTKEAEGEYNSQKILADAKLYTEQQNSEALLYAKEKEADGIKKIYDSESEGITKMITSFGGNNQTFVLNKMIENKVFEELAKTNATALNGLNPKINVWTHDPAHSMDTIQNIGKSLIPTLSIIKDQTGYELNDWLIKKNNDVKNI